MKILIVLTSHDTQGNADAHTGYWLEELAAPYYVFQEAGAVITLASPMGGRPPLDPRSNTEAAQTDATRRFKADPEAQAALRETALLADMVADTFDALFYPGGHGLLWDLVDNPHSVALIQAALDNGKPAAFVCHGPGALRHVKTPEGRPAVEDKEVTGFANTEEEAAGLTHVVPFSVEDMLKSEKGRYSKADDWQPHIVTDGLLITGQNPASSQPTARALLRRIGFFSPQGFVASVPWNSA
jgi:putative intracellular protease/amidase